MADTRTTIERTYWTRQWSDFDPHVEPLAMNVELIFATPAGFYNSQR